MKKFIALAAVAFALLAGTVTVLTTVSPQPAMADPCPVRC
jgi:hypothetical protein